MIVIYSTYIVCSAISNEPEDSEHCNPFNKKTQVTSTLLGVLFTFISIAYSTTRAAANGIFLGGDDDDYAPLLDRSEKLENKNDNESDSEDNVNYINYLFIYLFI